MISKLCWNCRRKLGALHRNEDAAVLPIFGMMVIFLVVIGGAAVDVSRTVNAREKLSYAIDAAALAVAAELSVRVMTDAQIETLLKNSFEANLDGEEFKAEAIKNIDHNVNPEAGTVTVSSSAFLENYFIDIGGYGLNAIGPETFSFGVSSEVSYSTKDIELSMVLDVTGSMRSHMTTLRTAAQDVIDEFLPEGQTEAQSKVRIAIVPYSQGVNLGSYADEVKGEDAYGYGNGGDCVTERNNYNKDNKVKYTDSAYNYYKIKYPSRTPTAKAYFGDGTYNCPSRSKLQPLTATRSTLVTAVKNLSAGGWTAGQTGVAWGWYTVSPNFNNLWPDASDAAEYSDEKVLKFVILMTDGNFNRIYNWDSDEEEYEEKSSSESYNGPASKRARNLCNAMKESENLQVFSIYFGTSGSSSAAKNMKYCATGGASGGYYFQASSRDKLIEAFGNIAKKIQAVRLSK